LEIEMRGVQHRLQREREMVWWGAMLPHLKEPVALDRFIGRPVDDRARIAAFHTAWDKIDRSLARH